MPTKAGSSVGSEVFSRGSGGAAHSVSVATAAATWLLLMVGCMVHGTGSSLACPDWPTCYGTFFPEMKNGVEYEHTHRLVATAVGMMTLALSVMLLLVSRKRGASAEAKTNAKLGGLAAFLVIGQGVLGGITVLFQLPIGVTLAHLGTSVCFFSLLVFLALRTQGEARVSSLRSTGVRQLVAVGGVLTLGQILMGGVVRHTHNGLACFKLPLCEGGAWPARLGQKIQMGHRYYGVLLACWIIGVAWTIYRRTEKGDVARTIVAGQVLLVATQIVLGVVSVWKSLPLLPVTAHLGVAALILVSHVVLFVRLPVPLGVAPSMNRDAVPQEAVHA